MGKVEIGVPEGDKEGEREFARQRNVTVFVLKKG